MRHVVRSVTSILATALLVASCAAPVPSGTRSAGFQPSLTLDAASIVDALATKPSRNWEDNAFMFPALRERQKRQGYRVQQAAGLKTGSHTMGQATSNVPAFSKPDVWHPGPN